MNHELQENQYYEIIQKNEKNKVYRNKFYSITEKSIKEFVSILAGTVEINIIDSESNNKTNVTKDFRKENINSNEKYHKYNLLFKTEEQNFMRFYNLYIYESLLKNNNVNLEFKYKTITNEEKIAIFKLCNTECTISNNI